MFSLGCVLYEMCALEYVAYPDLLTQNSLPVFNCNPPWNVESFIPTAFSSDLQQVVTRLLCTLVRDDNPTSVDLRKPNRRPSTTTLLADTVITRWLQEVFYTSAMPGWCVRLCLVNHWVMYLTRSTETPVARREQLLTTRETAVRARERLCEAREALLQAQTRR